MELLAPAGDKDKLRTALSYGADAVYLAGESFGLRRAAGNFSFREIEEAVRYAHKRGRKVYLAVNIFPTDDQMEGIEGYLRSISNIDLDGLIIADVGVVWLAQKVTKFRIHLSTQASTTNWHGVDFWKGVGVSRVILGREVSVREAVEIVGWSGVEVELFGHGSMCMAYSGNCTISNYTSDRDANRGGCTNSCRWEYGLYTKDMELLGQSYVMNSKDLLGIERIWEMKEGGVHSLKLEGRMKSHFYLATVVSIYRRILDQVLNGERIDGERMEEYRIEMEGIPNRGYTDGFLMGDAGYDSMVGGKLGKKVVSNYVGIVREVGEDFVLLQVKNGFTKDRVLNFHEFNGGKKRIMLGGGVRGGVRMEDISGEGIGEAKPNSLVVLRGAIDVEKDCIVSMGF